MFLYSTPGGHNVGDITLQGFPGGVVIKNTLANAGVSHKRCGFDSWVGKIPWRRKGQATPLAWRRPDIGDFSPWGRKEPDTTEHQSIPITLQRGEKWFQEVRGDTYHFYV